MTAIDEQIARIQVHLKERDNHLADCHLARAGGPDATLACAECGRAKWMHTTRHDTCPTFCWVTLRTITDEQIQALRFIPGVDRALLIACSQALNDFALGAGLVREARATCAAAINTARARVGGAT